MNEARPHSNLLQFSVPPLQDSDVRALMIAETGADRDKARFVSVGIVSAIGGHPEVAHLVAQAVATQGSAVIENNPKILYDIQDEILEESLNYDNLSDLEKNILSLLSWVPQLGSDIIALIIIDRLNIAPTLYADTLAELERRCLIQVVGGNYLITSSIRGVFRRKHGYGSGELRAAFGEVLRATWSRAAEDDQMRAELFDAIAYMAVLEGGTMDPAFHGLLLPATFQEIIRTTYDNRDNDDQALERVAAWGTAAKTMKMDETVREEILSYVLRAQCRLSRKIDAEDTLSFIDKRYYRSRFYLRSFYIRYTGGSIEEVVVWLEKAYEVKKYLGMVVADLAYNYQRIGAWAKLEKLIENEQAFLDRNAALLGVQAAMLIGSKRFAEAEKVIAKLRLIRHEDGRADSREAMILMHRDGNYREAQRILTERLERGAKSPVSVRRLRGIAAAYAGDAATAQADIEFLKGRPDGSDAGFRILARLKLTQGDANSALAVLSQVRFQTHPDRLLKAKILEAQIGQGDSSLTEKRIKQEEVEALRRSRIVVSEFEEV